MSSEIGANIYGITGNAIGAVTTIAVGKMVTDTARSALRSPPARKSKPAKKHSRKSHTTKSRTSSNSSNLFNRKWY